MTFGVVKSKGKGAITSTRHIRRIVQYCFDTAYERMKEDGLEEDAPDLKVATVQWYDTRGFQKTLSFVLVSMCAMMLDTPV